MNVFFLDKCPVLAAQMQCNKHVVKMILETAQMLCTAHRVCDGTRLVSEKTGKPLQQYDHPLWHNELYKCAHINHPSTKWIRESDGNYMWAYQHFIALCDEYTFRYGKIHQSDTKLRDLINVAPTNIKSAPADLNDKNCIAMAPELNTAWDFKSADTVIEAYQRYYLYKTTVISPFAYTKRDLPTFLLEYGYDYGAIFAPEEAPWKLN